MNGLQQHPPTPRTPLPRRGFRGADGDQGAPSHPLSIDCAADTLTNLSFTGSRCRESSQQGSNETSSRSSASPGSRRLLLRRDSYNGEKEEEEEEEEARRARRRGGYYDYIYPHPNESANRRGNFSSATDPHRLHRHRSSSISTSTSQNFRTLSRAYHHVRNLLWEQMARNRKLEEQHKRDQCLLRNAGAVGRHCAWTGWAWRSPGWGWRAKCAELEEELGEARAEGRYWKRVTGGGGPGDED